MRTRTILTAIMMMTAITALAPAALMASQSAGAGGAYAAPVPVPPPGVISKSPYLGAILVDASSGRVLFADDADKPCYPASMVKLMNLLIILELVDSGAIRLEDPVPVTAAASKIGGSQVYLKEKEVFPVDDLLYALIIQSANDAAVALAIHIAGTKEAFVDMMNRRARELGMTHTVFHSVHGLPPGRGQNPDVSTARDMAKLCVELLKHKKALDYTSATVRKLRADSGNPFIMRTHNHLLGTFEGCDGLKTGYYRKAGFSICATAARRGARAVAVVVGSRERKVRDKKARELLSRGLLEVLASSPPAAGGGAEDKAVPAASARAASEKDEYLDDSDKPAEASGGKVEYGDETADEGAYDNGRTDYDDMILIPKKYVKIAGIIILAACVPAVYFRIKRRRGRRSY